MYSLPKIHKADAPLRPIVASRGSITYNAARVLADVLSPLVGKTEHHIQNNGDFVNKVKDLEVPPGQKLVSYDVSALFTSIPVPDAIVAIERKLNSDPLLHKRNPLSRKRIIELLSFCLNATYFSYKSNIYKQKHGAAMGSPVSPIIANLYMEVFEAKAIRTAPNPPSVWLRYVDDTFVKIHEYFVNEFTEHLNSIDENIKFNTESEMEGKLPFLDSCNVTTLNDDGYLDLTVYRKTPHTDQYLNFESNHHLQHKRSVVRTLINRANCIITKPEQKDAEVRHVKSALKANGYKEWAFKIPPPKNKSETSRNTTGGQARTSVGLPYIRGTSETLARIFKNHGVGAYHNPFNTLRSILVHPKDTWSHKVWCRLWNPVSRMPCPVCRWNCPHTGDKDERPPKTEFSTNSCGRTWTSHQNGRCQSDSLWGQYVTTQDTWVHRNQDPPPGHQPRPGIWAQHSPPPPPPSSMTNCCYVTAVLAVTWPRRISLIRLMKWPWWLRKLATLQHIWLW